MATTNLGRVRFNMRGDYTPDADPLYSLLDLVSDGGGSFVYINDTPSNEPTSSASHWQQIASIGGQDLVDAAVAARNTAVSAKDTAVTAAAQLQAGVGSPAGKFANLAAVNAANPAHDRTYLTEDDWKIALWDEIAQAFVAGGVYQATGIANDSVTPDHLVKYEYKPNLFIAATVTDGYYIKEDGSIGALATFCYSDYIPVVSGVTYEYYSINNTGVNSYIDGGFYDDTLTWISDMGPSLSTGYGTYVAPADGFVRINTGTEKKDVTYFRRQTAEIFDIAWLNVKEANYETGSIPMAALSAAVLAEMGNTDSILTKWAGKTANFLGDSITYGSYLTDNTTSRFSALIAADLGMTENNYGVSGTRIGEIINDSNCMARRYTAMSNDADVIFVLGGTNDYGKTTENASGYNPFGVMTDRVTTTYYGALHVLMIGLIDKYIGKKIVIMTPPHRIAPSGISGYDEVVHPQTGKNLLDYVNAIREVAEFYGLPVLDLYKELNIRPSNATIRSTYTHDGLHPNEAGHRLIADTIINYMRWL